MFVGRASLELAGIIVDVQATLHLRAAGGAPVAWDGYFTTGDRAGANRLVDAQGQTGELVELRLADDPDSAHVIVTRLVGDHGELRGSGLPPGRLGPRV